MDYTTTLILDNLKYLKEPTTTDLIEEEAQNSKPNSVARNVKAHSLLALAEYLETKKPGEYYLVHKTKEVKEFYNRITGQFFTVLRDENEPDDLRTDNQRELDRLTFELAIARTREEKREARKALTAFYRSLRARD